jgi:hypothetical protein
VQPTPAFVNDDASLIKTWWRLIAYDAVASPR